MTSRIKDPNFDDDPVSKRVHDPKGTFWFRRDKRPETTEDQEIKQLTNSNEVQNHEEKICGVQICKRRKRLLLMDQREREREIEQSVKVVTLRRQTFLQAHLDFHRVWWLFETAGFIHFICNSYHYLFSTIVFISKWGKLQWLDGWVTGLLAVSFRDLVS